MRILHIIFNTTFTKPYIDFINSNFNSSEHTFLILGNNELEKENYNYNNVYFVSKKIKCILFALKNMYRCEKIILHGLFSNFEIMNFFIQPWLLKKCNWVIWGGDLYEHKFRDNSIKSSINEFFRAFVIQRMSGLITHVYGDYELAKLWYKTKGEYYYCFCYPSNLYKKYQVKKKGFSNLKTCILVGNSADKTNNHIEIFNKLSFLKNEDIEIICPLSYGDCEYRNMVVKIGFSLFGDKFKPITDFMKSVKYLELLATVDVALFNHKRQQALGNIISLIGMGKKVYIRDDVTTWEFCKMHELKVYNTNSTLVDVLEKLDDSEKDKNIENASGRFSYEKLKMDWVRIFSIR